MGYGDEHYMGPGPAWRYEDAKRTHERTEDRTAMLRVPCEGGPFHGEHLRLPHRDWLVWAARIGGEIRAVVTTPGMAFEQATADDTLGVYRFDAATETLRFLPGDMLQRVRLLPPD